LKGRRKKKLCHGHFIIMNALEEHYSSEKLDRPDEPKDHPAAVWPKPCPISRGCWKLGWNYYSRQKTEFQFQLYMYLYGLVIVIIMYMFSIHPDQ
jgi:hypothetical protein